jgi:arginine decarboxylase
MTTSTGYPFVPKEAFLTNGVGRHREKLQSFEMALRDAGIAQLNLVRVSSIFPPHCKLISKEAGIKRLKPGGVTFCVISDNATNEPHRLAAASVGIAIPKDPSQYGYLSEHHSYGQTDTIAGDYAEDLAASMLATILGLPFDPDKSWNETKQNWKISGEIVSTRNVVQSAMGHKDGLWTTVVAAAVFV